MRQCPTASASPTSPPGTASRMSRGDPHGRQGSAGGVAGATGVDEVEVTSFVSAKWVPQLGDASNVVDEVLTLLFGKGSTSTPLLSALIPNLAGLKSLRDTEARTRSRLMQTESNRWKTQGQYDAFERALIDLKVDKISVFTAASETFSKKNTNATIDETIERFKSLMAYASVPKVCSSGATSPA